MKNFGILMALFVMSCGLLISSASAEPIRLPQIGDNSIDYYSIPDRPGSIGWQYTDDNDYTDLLPYMLNLSKIIDNKWSYKISGYTKDDYLAIVNLTIYRDGSFSTPKIVKYPAKTDYMQQVLNTLNNFDHLLSLPQSYNRNELSVNLLFIPKGSSKEQLEKADAIDLAQYAKDTNNKINKKFQSTPNLNINSNSRTAVLFKLKKDGSLVDNKILIFQSSGNAKFDQTTINTIKNCHYNPLPEKYTYDTLNTIIIFEARDSSSYNSYSSRH